MKKLIALLLALAMATSLIACNSSTSKPSTEPSQGVQQSQGPQESDASNPEVKYPSGKTLTIIAPVAAGGAMDLVVRIAADYLDDILGCDVIVENIKGNGGGVAATEYLAQSANTDTLIYLPGNIFTVAPLYQETTYKFEDYIPIVSYNSEINGIFVKSDSGISSLSDLSKFSGALLFGSAGVGNANHLMQAALYKDMGLTAETIPHASNAEGIVNVIAGTTQIILSSMSSADQYIANGELTCIAVMSDEDYTFSNGTVGKSITSQGYDSSKYTIPTIQFFAIRSGSDEAIVNYLSEAFQTLYANPDFLKEYGEKCSGVLTNYNSAEIKSIMDTNTTAAKAMFDKIG